MSDAAWMMAVFPPHSLEGKRITVLLRPDDRRLPRCEACGETLARSEHPDGMREYVVHNKGRCGR